MTGFQSDKPTAFQAPATDSVPIPPGATGQYPEPVWIEDDRIALAEATAANADVPTPPGPTGQYPAPVWIEDDGAALVEAAGADVNVPTPPRPAGQYPEPVWIEDSARTPAEAAGAPVNRPAAFSSGAQHPQRLQVPGSSDASTGATDSSAELPSIDSGKPPPIPLDNQEIYQIVRAVAAGISGDALYEYVDSTHRVDDGVRVGLVGFRQANGELGQLLNIMKRRDPSLFAVIMGTEAETLLQVTNADNREARLETVGGLPLWHETWQEKFRRAGQQPLFQAAQNETAIERQFRPSLAAAGELALQTDRGLALLYDRVVAQGLAAGTDWMRQHLPPTDEGNEQIRLQGLLDDAPAKIQPRLVEIFNSPLLSGTTYTF